jgi:hypothetical protein
MNADLGWLNMRGAVVVVLVGALLAGCAVGPSKEGPEATAGSAAGLGQLAGVVVDEAVRPVAGATLTLGETSTISAADGTFRIEGVAPGTYVLQAAKHGFSTVSTEVYVPEGEAMDLVKLVLVQDASTFAYYEAYVLDGFIQCSVFLPGEIYYAACGAPNLVSITACGATGACLGNLTDDNALVLQAFSAAPDWVQLEAVWTPTTEAGRIMRLNPGATSPEEIANGFHVRPFNASVGPSPLLSVVDTQTLNSSGIGVDSLLYARFVAGPSIGDCSPPACLGAGVAANQGFTIFIHAFFNYRPPEGWRFTNGEGVPLPPMLVPG